MNIPEETLTTPITFTLPAANAVREVLAQKNLPGYSLRLFISGGGCSGYQYGLALDSTIRSEDVVMETDGIKLIIDDVSIKYLQGATVDYVEETEGSGFRIINPNSMPSCSCSQDSSTDSENSGGCAGCN
jgi:iron-sulfur cluster assembly accessory protein